ncbi:TetR/AcrR family transcriptional regulator [Bradyrhizobium sp. Ash2021]|uniref:TetR/AcrR family transcriptional regulator n=1 Tax=Bradyrhizobium sp. Ash2021 TaxID=2954771 RepID=UPI0028149F68|nr:TetR/AcrR family transcriptional regulator [Bradyrhizobium sp. Ash2021]WMT76324.1 TetR/AcrR family transcriptional regulator [Bradyrhizobium sp. Ash2021]
MTKRAEQKVETRTRIVDAAAKRFLIDGIEGATISKVLGDAGLTHGTFYAHFQSKETLLAEAFLTAAAETSERWIVGVSDLSTNQGIGLLLARALGNAHLKHPETGCPFVAAGSEIWRSHNEIRKAYEEGMLAVAAKVADSLGDQADVDHAIAIHAICIGGLTMARSVASEEVSLRVLRACRQFVLKRLQKSAEA